MICFICRMYLSAWYHDQTGLQCAANAQLADFATQAGASADVAASISREIYTPWVEQATQQAFASGVKQTPTVQINGTEFTGDLYTAGALQAAVEKAASGAK